MRRKNELQAIDASARRMCILTVAGMLLVSAVYAWGQVPGAPRAPEPDTLSPVRGIVLPEVAPVPYVDPDIELEFYTNEDYLDELEDVLYLESVEPELYELMEEQYEAQHEVYEQQMEEQHRLQEEAEERAREAAERAREAARLYSIQFTGVRQEIAQAYQEAYALILEEKWAEAREALDSFLEKFKDTRYTDDARFWICYALDKSGMPEEEIFDAYYQFIQEFADSKWRDDAKANLIILGRKLSAKSKKARTQYGPILEQLEQEYKVQVAIATLSRLKDVEAKNALQAIFSLYDRTEDKDQRKEIVYALRRFKDPAVVDKLVEIARKDSDKDVRDEAVNTLRRQGGEASIRALIALATGQEDTNTRTSAVNALGRVTGSSARIIASPMGQITGQITTLQPLEGGLESSVIKEVVNVLLELALNDPHVKVRTEAVSSLARINTPEAQEALIEILEGK